MNFESRYAIFKGCTNTKTSHNGIILFLSNAIMADSIEKRLLN